MYRTLLGGVADFGFHIAVVAVTAFFLVCLLVLNAHAVGGF